MSHRPLRPFALILASITACGISPALACSHGASPAAHGQAAGAPSGQGGAPLATSSAARTDGAHGYGGSGGYDGYSGNGGFWTDDETGGAGGATGTGGAGGGGAGGAGSTGGAGGAVAATASGGGGAVAASAASGSGQSSSGAVGCAIGHLVISQIRSRGAGGATDEFVELFNATGAPVTLDPGWTLAVRGVADTTYRAHWKGAGQQIPAYGHFLIAGTGYAQTPAADASLSSGIPDAASVVLERLGAPVDAVCYAYDPSTQAAFDVTFTCAGTPASNLPHDDKSSASSNVDASIVRKPGGPAGNCTDTGDSSADLVTEMPAHPESTASPPTP